MEYRVLGRTGLSVSVFGLGCGGHSRLGLRQEKGDENAIAIVRQALDAGVNFIDTAELYGTEVVVGKALKAHGISRESVIISTKVAPNQPGEERRRTADEFRAAAEESLRRLQTDYIDILHIHGVTPDEYDYCLAEFVPVQEALRAEGKIRFPGITEAFIPDPGHAMLQQAVQTDHWDVIMVGFSLLNQSARERVLSVTQPKGIGVLDMFAVRRALSVPSALRALLEELVQQGLVVPEILDTPDPLGFLITEGGAETVPDAAYRFCRDEPGIHVVLSGTGNPEHLAANLQSLAAPSLPGSMTQRLQELFARVDNVSGN